ncbi:hypothetical protein ACROYT_G029532 [Oculina patagonica]
MVAMVIYFKHTSLSLTCIKSDISLGMPVTQCPSAHCTKRLLDGVNTSQGLVLGRQKEQTVYLSIGIVSTRGEEDNLIASSSFPDKITFQPQSSQTLLLSWFSKEDPKAAHLTGNKRRISGRTRQWAHSSHPSHGGISEGSQPGTPGMGKYRINYGRFQEKYLGFQQETYISF